MKNIFTKIFTIFCFCMLYSSAVVASTSNDEDHNDPDYFEVMRSVNRVPNGFSGVPPLNLTEAKALYHFLKVHKLNPLGEYYPIQGVDNDSGQLLSDAASSIQAYQGDFDNTNHNELVFVTCSGSANVCDYNFFVYEKDKLSKIDFAQIIQNNFSVEMRDFFWWTAEPFIIRQGKTTYLRFRDGPGGHMNYDSQKLLVCTYKWNGEKIEFISEAKKPTATSHCPLPSFKPLKEEIIKKPVCSNPKPGTVCAMELN